MQPAICPATELCKRASVQHEPFTSRQVYVVLRRAYAAEGRAVAEARAKESAK